MQIRAGKGVHNVGLIISVSANADQMSIGPSVAAKHFSDICFKDTRTSRHAVLHFYLGRTLISLLILILKTAEGQPS